mgnify:CR=1 FL=1
MAKRFTDTEKWKKRFFKTLSCKHKLLWIYILDDCNHAGIWDVDLGVAGMRIGETFEEKETIKIFEENIIIVDRGDKWYVPKFNEFQYGELNPDSRVHKSVITILDKYGINFSDPKTVEVVETAKKSVKRCKAPTVEEVALYCKERKNKVDAERFCDFYESKGWVVGSTKMKNWKASVRSWEKNDRDKTTNKKSLTQSQFENWQGARERIKDQYR